MRHEKIIRRPDGNELTIRVELLFGANSVEYGITYYRNVANVSYINATPEEILSAKMELWERIKPTRD